MTDQQTPTNEEAVRDWASEWADRYDQTQDEEKIKAWVGKTVKVTREPDHTEDSDKIGEFLFNIVGYGIRALSFQPDEESPERQYVHEYSLLTDTGLQVPINATMTVEEHTAD
jgi:hypothetical protein